MRVAIYARVSREDLHAENQLTVLRAWCRDGDHTIVGEFIDHVSGGKGVEHRPQFRTLLETAPSSFCDLVLCWSLDRFSREGMVATVTYLRQLADCAVLFRSHQEPALSSDNEMIRNIVLAVMSELAKAERLRISERTKAGLARVRASGKPLGRPAVSPLARARIHELCDKHPDKSAGWIGRQLGLDPKTVLKYAGRCKSVAG